MSHLPRDAITLQWYVAGTSVSRGTGGRPRGGNKQIGSKLPGEPYAQASQVLAQRYVCSFSQRDLFCWVLFLTKKAGAPTPRLIK